jgi:hypothetical protein
MVLFNGFFADLPRAQDMDPMTAASQAFRLANYSGIVQPVVTREHHNLH